MTHMERLQDLLPPPYSLAADSLFSQLLNVVALELEILDEDLDRLRPTGRVTVRCGWLRIPCGANRAASCWRAGGACHISFAGPNTTADCPIRSRGSL